MILSWSKMALLAALLVSGMSAKAQQTVIFSKPAEISEKKSDDMVESTKRVSKAADFNAPKNMFQVAPERSTPNVAPQPNQDPRVLEALKKRKNWMLLTPEEIMGVKTVDQIMGMEDSKPGKKLSLEEKFLLRQTQMQEARSTNLLRGKQVSSTDNNRSFLATRTGQSPLAPFTGQQADDRLTKASGWSFNDPSKAAPNVDNLNRTPQPQATWRSVFHQTPSSQTRQNQDQIDSIQRFRSLMNGSADTETAARPATARNSFSTESARKLTATGDSPGHSVSKFEDSTIRPAVLKPLPTLTESTVTKPATKPAWQAQRPPWLSDAPPTHSLKRSF